MTDLDSPNTGGEYVYRALVNADIDLLVGLPGTQTLPLDRVVSQREEMRYVMARHETAIPHIAWGHYEASGRPAATLTVPGPGETNAMHGLKNALEDCVPIVHVTGDAHPDDLGKKPIHEIEPDTYDNVVKENITVDSETDLPAALQRGIERALTPPYGPVRLGVPSKILAAEFIAPPATVDPERVNRDNGHQYDTAAALLNDADRPVIYAGGGARRSEGGAEAVRSLADELHAAVITSYKGKGVFPENDPRFLGVTGSSLPPGARKALEKSDVVLALGSDFDGLTTSDWELPMGDELVHITLDPAAIGASYEPTIGIVDDVAVAAAAIQERLTDDVPSTRWDPAQVGRAVRNEYREQLRSQSLLNDGPPIHTPALLETVRDTIPEETIVTTDIGGFRLWAMQAFEAYEPEAFIAAGSWAGMGVGLPAAIGAKLAQPNRPVVCCSGDGGLLMCLQELATAIEEDLDIVLVVSNNNDYGIISKSPKIETETDDHAFSWSSPSFPAIAEGFGWMTESVEETSALETALESALDRNKPTLIDVSVPTEEPSAAAAANFGTEVTIDSSL